MRWSARTSAAQSSSCPSSFWIWSAGTLVIASGLTVMAVSFLPAAPDGASQKQQLDGDRRGFRFFLSRKRTFDRVKQKRRGGGGEEEETVDNESGQATSIRLAFVGNSILYFNDCPRLLQNMLRQGFDDVQQDSCLRGGATLSSLWTKGNGMRTKFATEPAALPDGGFDIGAPTVASLLLSSDGERKEEEAPSLTKDVCCWDYVILNDHTQSPARPESKEKTCTALEEHYAPAIVSLSERCNRHLAVPVFLQTPAYLSPDMRGTEDLGDFDQFTDLVAAGYREYVEFMERLLEPSDEGGRGKVLLAPVGEAYRYLKHHNAQLWEKLYSWDHFHPSPSGTWLQACVLYCTITGAAPPDYQAVWWKDSRVMQPADQDPLPRPDEIEAAELKRVACLVCGIGRDGGLGSE